MNVKTFEEKVNDEATKQWLERHSVLEKFRVEKANKACEESQAKAKAAASVRQEEQRLVYAQKELEKQKIILAGGVLFKADAPKSYRPTKAQTDFAGKLAREIRDSGATDNSAHSLAKYFTIDTLIAMKNAIKAGKVIVIEF